MAKGPRPDARAPDGTDRPPPVVLLTGPSGYVGGRLLGVLARGGRRVRCLARRPGDLAARAPRAAEVVRGDVLDRASLDAALRGVDAAYYLVHAMGSAGDFEAEERTGARNFAAAAQAAGVGRIIYLGGLGGGGADLSAHLRSRRRVGGLLRCAGVPVVEFRASIVIGSGSLSFELVRALTERLPVMVTPRWVAARAQPIAVDDLLGYLRAALDLPLDGHRTFEIGGADVVSYGGLMREYARQRGLRRLLIAVPVLTPRLSSLWLGLVTPVYARIGRKLIDSLRHDSVVGDPSARTAFDLRPVGTRAAIAAALRNEDRAFAETRWSDARSSSGPEPTWGGVRFGARLVDSRTVRVPAPPPAAFAPIRRIGGAAGWYHGDVLWRIRGLLDLLAGGVGLRRGRRDPERLAPGDTVDWWRVERCEPDRRLRLAAEMKVPGRAWLDFEVTEDAGGSIIRQTAEFDPAGVAGLLYWYALWPLHALVFGGMLRGIARRVRAPAPPDGS